MNASGVFSWRRFKAVVAKEFVQMRRDRLTFAMLVVMPLMQLVLFGYAINSDPRHLPTAVLSADNSIFSRSVTAAMRNSEYFDILRVVTTRAEAEDLLRTGTAQFVLTIPEDFGTKILRGEKPVLLLEADATDPSATSNAVGAFKEAVRRALDRDLAGAFGNLASSDMAVDLRIHAEYNPEAITQYNIVPGLMGTILTLTLVMITALAITRETERGTMENLLSTPVSPLEVMIGKILPYILVGYIQMTLIMLATRFLFNVPMHGSLVLIYSLSVLFIAANLTIGVTFSTLARNQLQALQMSIFFFMPSMLLTGFMFPFRGMPAWAQVVGSILPLTHYLRLVRGILLKGDGLEQSLTHVWPMALIWLAAVVLGTIFFRRTLD